MTMNNQHPFDLQAIRQYRAKKASKLKMLCTHAALDILKIMRDEGQDTLFSMEELTSIIYKRVSEVEG